MALFVAALNLAPGAVAERDADFEAFVGRLPFYASRPTATWRGAGGRDGLWCVTEEDDGVARLHADGDVAAAFFGRPIIWRGPDAADGRAVLEPGFFARPLTDWAHDLDGRCVVLRFEAGLLDVYTDPGGSYPVYVCPGADDEVWLSNAPLLASRMARRQAAPAPAGVVASIVGGGWSLSGDPPMADVHRLPPETTWSFDADGTRRPGVRLLDLEALRAGTGAQLDARGAQATVKTALAALADWPGRRNIVPLTGGRDSRVVLSAALGRFDFDVVTGGGDGDPDVEIARELARRSGLEHALMGPVPGGDRLADPVRAATSLFDLTGGTASLADAAGFPMAASGVPRPLWHSGQGGEVGRRIYGDLPTEPGKLLDALTRRFLGRRPGRPDLLTDDGEALVREELGRFLDEALASGFEPADVPDLFYVRRRMGTWAGPTHAAVEPVRDVTSVLWSRRVVPLLLTGSRDERARERFHREVVGACAAQLMAVAFQDGTRWVGGSPRADRARRLAGKVRRELRRRSVALRDRSAPTSGPSPGGPVARDPRVDLFDLVREAALGRDQLPDVLDRGRVEALLALPPDALDEWRWFQTWRVASLVLPGPPE